MKVTHPSPNHYSSRNKWKPDMIVCHIGEGSFSSNVGWLTNPESKASSHAVIGEKGETAILVDYKYASYCNGTSTDPSSNLFYGHSTLNLVRERKTNANYYTYTIEHSGYSYKGLKGALTEPQYQSTLAVMKDMILDMKNTYGVTFIPDREHLVGHYQISPKTKGSCPCPPPHTNFPFERLLTDIKKWMEEMRDMTEQETRKIAKEEAAAAVKAAVKAPPKPDNTPSPYAIGAIDRARKKGILTGGSGGDLQLHSTMTREAFFVALDKLGLL